VDFTRREWVYLLSKFGDILFERNFIVMDKTALLAKQYGVVVGACQRDKGLEDVRLRLNRYDDFDYSFFFPQ
jgi:hypothetical protein